MWRVSARAPTGKWAGRLSGPVLKETFNGSVCQASPTRVQGSLQVSAVGLARSDPSRTSGLLRSADLSIYFSVVWSEHTAGRMALSRLAWPVGRKELYAIITTIKLPVQETLRGDRSAARRDTRDTETLEAKTSRICSRRRIGFVEVGSLCVLELAAWNHV